MTLRNLAYAVIDTYDRRLQGELDMLAFGEAVERMRKALASNNPFDLSMTASEPEAFPFELQAMAHISKILGALPPPARFRAIMVVALTLAPDVFSEREFSGLVKKAKGSY